MKTITRKIVLPEWAKFIAKDCEGTLYAFELAPVPMHGYWEAPDGECERVCNGVAPKRWRDTLERI